ncbi:Crp/Fnr family transcriptional regulator [Clostridium sp. B9]|uniref:Crp/Fnr family transcriptional regulator n=1 Tax=Clostridium sp. B9 TaxID=3423224 RepID=UPI003D2ED898
MNKISLEHLREISFFSGLKDDTLNYISQNSKVLKKRKGEHIFRDKDIVEDIYIVIKGKVTLYKMNEYGQKRIVYILGEGAFLNEVVVDDLPSSINGEVFENAIILSIDKSKLMKGMGEDFELTKVVLNEMSKKIRRLYRQLKNVTPIKLEKRVAAKLWKLSKDYGKEVDEGTLIDLDISITYLADMFGSPRESVSRAIKTLRDENLIIKNNKKIIITDRDKISAYFKSISLD